MSTAPNPVEIAPAAEAKSSDQRWYASCIFWGLMLILLDLGINDSDFFPDGIGYALICWGCSGLKPLSGQFALAAALAWAMAVLSFFAFAVPPKADFVFGVGASIVNCAMMWTLLSGMRDVAAGAPRPKVARRAALLRIAFVTMIASACLFPSAEASLRQDAFKLLVVVLSVVLVIVQVMILYVVYQVRRLLAAGQLDPAVDPGT